MSRTALLTIGLAVAAVCASACGQDLLPLKHVVVFNNNGRKPPSECVYPLFRLSEPFALAEDFYTPGTLDATIADNLARSRMLYVGQYSDESPLFADANLCEAIRSLLKSGGVLFFDYNTGSHGVRFHSDTVAFLKSVGVAIPDEFRPGYGKSVFADANVHAVLAKPVSVGGIDAGHYGWWEKWPAEQIVLAHDKEDKGKATLLMQQGVLGRGAVVFNQLPAVFRASSGSCFDLVRNIVSYAYAEGR